jgi:DNA-binding PadR family transcriptional regulator
MFQHLILGLLREKQRSHGYALAKAYERLSGNPGYPANAGRELRRLEKEGLVKRESNPCGDRPIFFEITPKGCEVFDNWLVSPRALEEDFPTWLLFIDRVPEDQRARLLERREEDLWLMSKQLNRARDDALALLKQPSGNNHSQAEAAHLRLRIMLISTELDFIAECRRGINGKGKP